MDDEFDLNEDEEQEILKQQSQHTTIQQDDDEFDVDEEDVTFFTPQQKQQQEQVVVEKAKSTETNPTVNPLEALKAQYANEISEKQDTLEKKHSFSQYKVEKPSTLELPTHHDEVEEEEVLTPSHIATGGLLIDESEGKTPIETPPSNENKDIWAMANQEAIARERSTGDTVGIGKKPEIQKIIRLEQLHVYLREAKETKEALNEVEKVEHSGLHSVLRLFQMFSCYAIGTPLLKSQTLEDQRAYIFALCKTKLDWTNVKHVRLLFSIYRRLMDENSNPPMKGSHWEYIGFQRPNPETDLRDGGIFGLMQLLYFLEKDKRLVARIFKMALDKTSEFPFAIVGLNMTQIVLHTVRQGKLQRVANNFNDFLEAVNMAYCAVFYDFFETWKGGKEIHQYGMVKKELQAKALSKMGTMIKEYKANVASYNKQMKEIENKEKMEF